MSTFAATIAILAALATAGSLVAWKLKRLSKAGAIAVSAVALGLVYLAKVPIGLGYLLPLAGVLWATGAARWLWRQAWSSLTKQRAVKGPMRQHLNVDGKPKRVYQTLDQAQSVAERQAASEGGSTAHAYQCGICQHYHVGH